MKRRRCRHTDVNLILLGPWANAHCKLCDLEWQGATDEEKKPPKWVITAVEGVRAAQNGGSDHNE